MPDNLRSPLRWTIVVTLLVNAAAMLSPIINSGDAITYASLAQHIAQHGDWANLVLDGQDWLDKPHLPFWITALSFMIGGVSAFTYILPGFLFHLVGGYYTYRIARLFYGRDVAWLSALVFVSAYQVMDIAIEVRAEAYLTGFIMGACYYWLRYDAQGKWKHLLLGALFTAGAVMTKGVFTLITISSGLVCMWLYLGQWRKLFSPKWLAALALTLLFTAPEFIALYLQFDAHPEKAAFGHGIRFFLWDGQFGRFFNTGPIQNHGGHPFYFVLVFLWAFLPWVAVFVAAMYAGARAFAAGDRSARAHSMFLTGAFFVTFVLFSATSFQLDYYAVIVFPFATILCGKFLNQQLAAASTGRRLLIVHVGIALLLAAVAIGLSIFTRNVWATAVLLAVLLGALVHAPLARNRLRMAALVIYPVLAIDMVYAVLALTAALTFSAYEIPYNAKKALAGKPAQPIYFYQMPLEARELGLYSSTPSSAVDSWTQLPANKGSYWLIVRDAQLAELRAHLPGMTEVTAGRWIVHKTGTLLRLLRLARDGRPLETVHIMQVAAPNS